MLKALLLSLTLALAAMAMAQINLLPNGSFEDTVNCAVPTQNTLLKAEHWYNPNLSTPDVFDADLDRLCGYAMTPSQPSTYMEPHDGLRLAGVYMWDGPTGSITREYLMTKLSESLVPGGTYEVSLRYARRRPHRFAVDHVGIWIGHDSLFESTIGRLDVVPQLKLRDPFDPYLVNGDSWTELIDTLTAVGGERWLVIGNFDEQDSVDWVLANPSGNYGTSYYYIDDVQVKSIGSTGMSEAQSAMAWWNGYGLALQWVGLNGPVQVKLFDATGRLVQQVTVNSQGERAVIPMAPLRAGMYIITLQSGSDRAAVRFVKGEGGF